jgi:hypothetical protein
MLSGDFLKEFKRATEAKWREKSIDPRATYQSRARTQDGSEALPRLDLPRSEPEAELLPPETKIHLKENNPSLLQLLGV